MAIRYKVVNKATRCSVVIGANSLYTLRYNKDTTVYARPRSLGIMVFKRRYQAQKFATLVEHGLIRTPIILRVEVFERGKYPKCISRWTTHERDLNEFYHNHYTNKKYLKIGYGSALREPPKGTLCYDMVKVID